MRPTPVPLSPAPIVVGCDPGLDDAVLLAFLLAIRANVRGVIASHGNPTIDHAVRNARAVLTLAGRPDIPVIRGAAVPAHWNPVKAEPERFGGANGFMGVELPEGSNPVLNGNGDGVDHICDLLERCGAATLVNSGPATAPFMAWKRSPQRFRDSVARRYVMGGAFKGAGCAGTVRSGQKFGCAEFNVFHDPEAFAALLSPSMGSFDPVVATWDSRGVFFLKENVERMRSANPLTSYLIRAMQQFFVLHPTDNYDEALSAPQIAIFDVVLAFALCGIGKFEDEHAVVTTEGPYYGETKFDPKGVPIHYYTPPNNSVGVDLIMHHLGIELS